MITTAEDYNVYPYLIVEAEDQDHLLAFIDKVEKDFLRQVFGSGFLGIVEDLDIDNLPPRWEDIINGGLYDDANGRQRTWLGLKEMFKPYVKAAWENSNVKQDTEVGAIEADTENSVRVSNASRNAEFNNELVRAVGDFNYCNDTLMQYFYFRGSELDSDFQAIGYTSLEEYLQENFSAGDLVNDFDL
jgi:hypothetical protein